MQDDESIPEQTKPVTAGNLSSWRRTAIAIVIIVITALITGTSGYLLGIRTNQNASQSTQRVSFPPSPTTIPTSIPPQISIPQPKTGYEQRINGTLKYGYSYPISTTLPLRVEKSGPFLFNGLSLLQPSLEPNLLLDSDLFCSADGPQGSHRCQNTKVEDFTNSLGFKGFKVYRTRTNVYRIKPTAGKICETCDDVVYVFPLQEKINGYDGVIFSLDTLTHPTQENLSDLEIIANSFFSF